VVPFQSSFVLEEMCEIMESGMQADKGFKEVHFTAASC
jgi:hypothetical protein